MEQKRFLLSALGVGLGVGIGLVSGQTVSRWNQSNDVVDGITVAQIELELLKLVIDGKSGNVTFEDFPYYLR